jgi:hypothetical protein
MFSQLTKGPAFGNEIAAQRDIRSRAPLRFCQREEHEYGRIGSVLRIFHFHYLEVVSERIEQVKTLAVRHRDGFHDFRSK